jgi:hypothetical protein
MPQLKTAIIVHDTTPVNTVVLPPSAEDAAAYCANFDGICIVPDPDDGYGTDFLTLTGCVAVEVTGADPMPGVGTGWTYVDGEWLAPSEPPYPS